MNRISTGNGPSGRARQTLAAAAAVVGLSAMMAGPASALELGELRMESTLGQPLRATIPYTLGPDESLYDFCIALHTPATGGAIPSVTRAGVTVTNDTIVLTGKTVVRDPLLAVRVAVDCPYTPHVVREYTMIVDPVLPEQRTRTVAGTPAPARAAVPAAAASAPATVQAAATATVNPAPVQRNDVSPVAGIPMNSTYRVQNGDSVSAIAARIEGRTTGLWPTINALVAANPEAFVDGDANQLVSGSELFIPHVDGAQAAVSRNVPAEPRAAANPDPVVEDDPVAESAPAPADMEIPAEADVTAPAAQPAARIPENPVTAEAAEPAIEPAEPVPAVAETQASPAVDAEVPGSAIAGADDGTTAAADDELRPGDVVLSAPAVTGDSGATRSVPTVSAPPAAESGTPWFVWLAAGAAALGLLYYGFGSQLKERFGSVAVNAPAPASDPVVEEETVTNPIVDDVDFEFEDTVNAEAISLDADLDAGTGLHDSDEIDVAQDFGFDSISETDGHVDLEIPEEALLEPDEPDANIIPPSHRADESSILEAEFQPSDEEYDMSMIVDATKQDIGDDDLTAQDLHAVPVDSTGDYSVENDTLATEMDLQALEQDYEEEFTQTQAINEEIEKAAAELAKSMAAREDSDDAAGLDFELEPTAVTSDNTPDLDLTAAMPDLDPTAEMPDRGRDPGLDPTVEMSTTADDSGTNPELTANIPVDVDAINDDDADPEEITARLVAGGGDLTIEMDIESGSVDTSRDSD